ncbi:MAG: hypothetical protein IJM34_12065 [Lachnospiraceae bacterium]|nr:hypothetical protein [Lachnospiraceae bacterium]
MHFQQWHCYQGAEAQHREIPDYNDIPKDDKITIGYYTDTSEYREKEYVANLWLAWIGAHSFSGNYYFEPTKDGYFVADLSATRDMSGLYAITLGPNGKADYLWFN